MTVPVIIYFYFLQWKTGTIYGDDLFTYKGLSSIDNFSDIIKNTSSEGKYRPVNVVCVKLIFELFHKNVGYYYLFNVLIQAINTCILALLIDVFLCAPVASVLFSLVFGLSRFSYFNISQLFNGGALEGLAMTFFLLCLLFIVRALIDNELTATQKYKRWLWCVLFANLCMYTHERYVVLFPFIILMIIFFPEIKALSSKQRVSIGLLAFFSVVLNAGIKKYVYSMPLFVGTGHTNITLSFASISAYLGDALLSIFQMNSGPEYLVGIRYSSLSTLERNLILLLISSFLTLLLSYLVNVKKYFALKDELQKRRFCIFMSLCLLFGLCLAPAVVTIRLEQRWLQASLSIFVVLIAIAYDSIRFKNNFLRCLFCISFVSLFAWSDHNYLEKGIGNIYLNSSEHLASAFKQALDNDVIHTNTTRLFILEQQKQPNRENEISWAIGKGYLFEFYNGKKTEVIFADTSSGSYDSLNRFMHSYKDSTQVIYLGKGIADVTGEYYKDSLKSFTY